MAKSVWRTARDGQPVKLSVSPPSDVNDPSMFRVERERDVFSRNGFLTAMENVVSSSTEREDETRIRGSRGRRRDELFIYFLATRYHVRIWERNNT